MKNDEAKLPGDADSAVLKQLSLIQVLCKTYKKDTIFAGSLTKLLGRLEDEMVRERARYERAEERKKMYKQLARKLHYETESKLLAERDEFEQVKLQMATVIEE